MTSVLCFQFDLQSQNLDELAAVASAAHPMSIMAAPPQPAPPPLQLAPQPALQLAPQSAPQQAPPSAPQSASPLPQQPPQLQHAPPLPLLQSADRAKKKLRAGTAAVYDTPHEARPALLPEFIELHNAIGGVSGSTSNSVVCPVFSSDWLGTLYSVKTLAILPFLTISCSV
jgi:hypothetical protein